MPLPAMSKDAPENSPIFFLHGVGFGLVRTPLAMLSAVVPASVPAYHMMTISNVRTAISLH